MGEKVQYEENVQLSKKELIESIYQEKLIKFENKDSILAKLSNDLIINYINKASFSKNFFLYILKDKKNTSAEIKKILAFKCHRI